VEQLSVNRLTSEREKVKDHVMHIERLRQIKPAIKVVAPKKQPHMSNNLKKELSNLERMTEI